MLDHITFEIMEIRVRKIIFLREPKDQFSHGNPTLLGQRGSSIKSCEESNTKKTSYKSIYTPTEFLRGVQLSSVHSFVWVPYG